MVLLEYAKLKLLLVDVISGMNEIVACCVCCYNSVPLMPSSGLGDCRSTSYVEQDDLCSI